jgi:hypothetical protein
VKQTIVTADRNAPPGATPGWLFSPWIDALGIANIAWPLYVLAQTGDGFSGQAGLHFWQIYFVTTPHRWITLFIVFLDRERLQRHRGLFLGIASGVVLLCLGLRLTTGALTCLLAVDYLWNAWHFASQHHGIYRIYGRSGPVVAATEQTIEKWAMRGFLLYVTLRVASATWTDTALEYHLRQWDWIVLLVPAWLLLRCLSRHRRTAEAATGADNPACRGRLESLRNMSQFLYLVSVLCLYLAMLWAVHERRLSLVLSLATAAALFHAIEYLTLVSWSMRQRNAALAGRLGALGYLAPRWGIALAAFVIILGAGGWLMDQRLVEEWLFLNVVVAFLHYAYDGIIWRRRANT